MQASFGKCRQIFAGRSVEGLKLGVSKWHTLGLAIGLVGISNDFFGHLMTSGYP